MENTSISFSLDLEPKYLFEMRTRPGVLGFCEVPGKQSTTVSIITRDKKTAAMCISDFILKAGSLCVAEKHLDKNYSVLTGEEKQQILKSLESRKTGVEVSKSVFDVVSDYLRENKSMNIDGFIKFRLKYFSNITKQLADITAEDIIARSRCDDAAEFLKYYVSNSGALNEQLNVIFSKDGDFVITDILGNPVFIEDLLIAGIDKQEAILGIFTDLLPRKIIIHKENYMDPELKKLLYYIFEKRIFVCTGCDLCDDE